VACEQAIGFIFPIHRYKIYKKALSEMAESFLFGIKNYFKIL